MGFVLFTGLLHGDDFTPTVAKFKACANVAGAGIYWVDTTSGQTWWANPATMKWVYCGKPEETNPGPTGTFRPYKNRSGEGVFVLNTATGQGWWTDGKQWKALGKPLTTDKPTAKQQ